MGRPATRDSYHHGNARNALLAAASGLVETVGAVGLSLRQVAEKAGVSRQAPYNHFADKEALLAELVRNGFERLSCAVGAATDSPDSLSKAAEAYIGFAQAAPALFRLMFSKELIDLSRFPEASAAAAVAFGKLAAIVATIAREEDLPNLSLAAWCLVHGYATLCIETGLEDKHRRADRARLFARMIEAAAAQTRT
jgi:AcrR family transcriptional regulator